MSEMIHMPVDAAIGRLSCILDRVVRCAMLMEIIAKLCSSNVGIRR